MNESTEIRIQGQGLGQRVNPTDAIELMVAVLLGSPTMNLHSRHQ